MGYDETAVLRGGFAPVEHEITVDLTDVEGEIPRDLHGMHVRNGPNRQFAAAGRYHWFDGDGMLHALRFDGGQVQYQNRWISTQSLSEERAAGTALWQGIKDPPRRDRPDMPLKNTANTDVKFFAGELLAMWYLGGEVHRIRPSDLHTTGTLAMDPRLAGLHISAHSKVDERTGEFIFFCYGKEPPYMHYGVLDKTGVLKTLVPVALPGARLPHDMAVTRNFSVLHDLPLFQDPEAAAAGRHKVSFYPELPSRFGVIPRHGTAADIRWFEAAPAYMYHVSNAWEEDDGQGGIEIVMTGTPFKPQWDARGQLDASRLPRLIAQLGQDCMFYEWRFNLRTGQTRERVLDDVLNQEFPIINSAYLGERTRYSWNTLMANGQGPEEPRFCGIARHDLQQGSCTSYHAGIHKWFSEHSFAPKDQAVAEDDGYLVGFMWDDLTARSYATVFDARNVAQGPVARIALPQRVPNGFHATWVSRERLNRGW
ncbi:MAG: carotenoid oxygenase family protein [Rhodoferax sp.]